MIFSILTWAVICVIVSHLRASRPRGMNFDELARQYQESFDSQQVILNELRRHVI